MGWLIGNRCVGVRVRTHACMYVKELWLHCCWYCSAHIAQLQGNLALTLAGAWYFRSSTEKCHIKSTHQQSTQSTVVHFQHNYTANATWCRLLPDMFQRCRQCPCLGVHHRRCCYPSAPFPTSTFWLLTSGPVLPFGHQTTNRLHSIHCRICGPEIDKLYSRLFF